MPQVEFSEEELISLRWILDNWGLGGDVQNNCPFVYHYGTQALRTLESLDKSSLPNHLSDHPIVAQFYASHEECEACGAMRKKTESCQHGCTL